MVGGLNLEVQLLRLVKGRLPFKSAEVLKEAVIRLLLPLKARVHSLTSDNGMAFSRPQAIARQIEADYYLCLIAAGDERECQRADPAISAQGMN